ncbi:hypothetical protein Tco_0826082, partial [Tanacetum coccineum]
CYLALSDKLDWINPEGDRCPFDMSKPLPLQGPPGHLTVPVEFFFNTDLEYLNSIKVAYDKDAAFGISHWFPNVRYSTDQELQLNHRMKSASKVLTPDTDFCGLSMEDSSRFLAWGLQKALLLSCLVFQCIFKKKKVMLLVDFLAGWENVSANLFFFLLFVFLHGLHKQNFVLGYNEAMPTRKFSKKDQEQTTEMLKLIDDRLLERWILRSLECYVGGRLNETDYRLRMRTI